MARKPKLYCFDGRGKMESVRWLLAAAGVEFEEEFLETREQYEKLLQGGSLMFQQVPMMEIDGMKMVLTRAILSYIAAKYNLYGKDLKERALHLKQGLAASPQSRNFYSPEARENLFLTINTWRL